MILLDTHVLLWLLAAPDRIGSEAKRAITEADRVCFSAVSVAEIEIKRLIGRIDVPADIVRVLRDQGLTALPLAPEHAAAVGEFPSLTRHDPFDRLLLATAVQERLRFLTADDRLLALGLGWVLDARR